MASNIDPTQPPASNPTTAAMRANMAAAKAEIESLQDREHFAKVFLGTGGPFNGVGTLIPNSVNGAGDYNTKAIFQGLVYDTLGTVIDMANSRLNVPSGFSFLRITYNIAWATNDIGWRGCRVKNSAGSNYGNVRIPTVGNGASTNNNFVSPWIAISTNVAPDSVAPNSFFELYPAQNSGISLTAGVDLASSFVAMELRR
jgi:hypothetical protein